MSGTGAYPLGFNNPFRYRGYYFDYETNLYYLQSRYYDPVNGRFLNADGEMSGVGTYDGYNLYAYCFNDPINFFDPYGNWPSWNDIKNAGKAFADGFTDFFSDQWNTVKSVVTDPIDSYIDYMSDPWNHVLWAKVIKDNVLNSLHLWGSLLEGDFESIAYEGGRNTAAAVEVAASYGVIKFKQVLQNKGIISIKVHKSNLIHDPTDPFSQGMPKQGAVGEKALKYRQTGKYDKIYIVKNSNNMYIVVNGNHTVAALVSIGLEYMKVYITK